MEGSYQSPMKTLVRSLSVFLALAFAGSAHAVQYYDWDLDGGEGQPEWTFLDANGNSTWSTTFDLFATGYNPLVSEIISATVYFAFADNGDQAWDYATITVGGIEMWSWQEVDGSHQNAPNNYDWYMADLSAAQVAELQDGSLDYRVDAVSGNFYLKEAVLVAEGETRRINVPDSGTTFAMLGLGTVVMLVLRRQLRSAQ